MFKLSQILIIVLMSGALTGCLTDAQVSELVTNINTQTVIPSCVAGTKVTCNSLAALWSTGDATCRPAGDGYDVTQCSIPAGTGRYFTETVYPAQRDRARFGNALCNNGEDFVFEIDYPRLTGGQKPNEWIIELEGGGMCYLEGPEFGGYQCFYRDDQKLGPYLADGTHFAADRTARKGVYHPQPGFESAIHVHASYCSSDLWTGTNLDGVMMGHSTYAPGEKRLWKFTGRYNVLALLDVLGERYGLHDSLPNLAIHLRGQSAGGAGVAQNAFLFAKRFPNTLARNDLVASSWQYFLPLTWQSETYTVFGSTSTRLAMDAAIKVWKSEFMPECEFAYPGQSDCISGSVLYDFITKPRTGGGLGMNMMVFMNRQDQLYMNMSSLPMMSTTISGTDLAARQEFIHEENEAMGITINGVPQSKPRVSWLYAVSDPEYDHEVNVHPPLDYQTNPPDGATNSVDAMTQRFWKARHDPAVMAAGEVHLYDCNWVVGRDTVTDCR